MTFPSTLSPSAKRIGVLVAVRPGTGKVRLLLQESIEGAWQTKAHATTKRAGTVKLSMAAPKEGPTTLLRVQVMRGRRTAFVSHRRTVRLRSFAGGSAVCVGSFVQREICSWFEAGVTESWHQSWNGFREYGTDFGLGYRTPVYAIEGGRVLGAGFYGGGGIVSVEAHPGISEYYQHLSDISVGDGQVVSPGQLIGYSGGQIGYGRHPATCCSGGSHLEWGINAPYGGYWNPLGANIDPVPYLTSLLNGGSPGGSTASGGYYTIAATSVYAGPGTDQPVVDSLPIGAAVNITCQTRGGLVGNSTIWDMLAGQASNGSSRYVPDYNVDTPNDGTFSPPLPQCSAAAQPQVGPIGDLGFIKLRNTAGTVEVHLDRLQGGSLRRITDATSDFRPGDAGNGVWQLFGYVNGAPELGFIKLHNTAGTVEVHWDTFQNGSYKRAGDYVSDFSPADAANGSWDLIGSSSGAPVLGFVKTINTGGTVEAHWDSLQNGSYKRAGDYTSDFQPNDAGNGVWQLFGSSGGAPELGFIKLFNAGSRTVEVHWDTLQNGSYKRVGSYTSDFGPGDTDNGTWNLYGSANAAPELGFTKLRNTGSGTVEGHSDVLNGSAFKRIADYGSDFSPGDAGNGVWQVGSY